MSPRWCSGRSVHQTSQAADVRGHFKKQLPLATLTRVRGTGTVCVIHPLHTRANAFLCKLSLQLLLSTSGSFAFRVLQMSTFTSECSFLLTGPEVAPKRTRITASSQNCLEVRKCRRTYKSCHTKISEETSRNLLVP